MSRLRDARGSALVEMLLLILVMFVPVVSLLGSLARVHTAALAVTSAAREGGSAAASAADGLDAGEEFRGAVAETLRAQTLDPGSAEMSLQGTSTFGRGSRVEVRVAYPVRVMRIPFTGDAIGPVLWVRASHASHVDRYRSER